MAIAWTTIENAIHAWFVAGTGLSNVLWANQHVPQLAKPYGVLRLLAGPIRLGHDEQRNSTNLLAPAGEEVSQTITGQRQLVVSCQVYSDNCVGAGTAREYLSNALTAIDLPTNRFNLNNAGLSVINAAAINDLTDLLGTRFESRAALDVTFNLVDQATEKSGFIDTVNSTSTFS